MRKRREYARLGVTSYWLLDVDVPSLRVLELVAGDEDYVERAFGVGDEPVSVQLPFAVTVVPALLVRG